jgi:hypothetical protein
MKSSVCYEIQGSNILAITYTGRHPHSACLDWVRAVLQNDPEIPRQFGLLLDLRSAMAHFEFEDLLDLARFWASQRHRITSLAAVVDVPQGPDGDGVESHMDAHPQLITPGAGFRIFANKASAVRWLDPVCGCQTQLM